MSSTDGARAVLDRIYAAFAAGEFGPSLPHLDEHVVLIIADDIPDGGTYIGHDGVRDYMTHFLEPWETLTIEPESVEQAGDSFFVHVLQKGTGRGSHASAELRYTQHWTFRDCKVVRIDVRLGRAA